VNAFLTSTAQEINRNNTFYSDFPATVKLGSAVANEPIYDSKTENLDECCYGQAEMEKYRKGLQSGVDEKRLIQRRRRIVKWFINYCKTEVQHC